MEMNFCRRCGTKLERAEGWRYTCVNGHNMYAKSLPAVGVFFLTQDNQVMLAVRGREPRKGMLDAFGGFVDPDDDGLEAAGQRELEEELALHPGDYEPLQYLTSKLGHYPYEGEDLLIISTLFWTRLTTDRPLTAADDVADTKTIPLHEIDLTELHDEDIREGILALQTKFPKEEI